MVNDKLINPSGETTFVIVRCGGAKAVPLCTVRTQLRAIELVEMLDRVHGGKTADGIIIHHEWGEIDVSE